MKVSLKAALAPLALCTLGAVALALHLTGAATGRWTEVDRNTATVQGMLFTSDGVPAFRLEALLAGADDTVTGVLRAVPPKPNAALPFYRINGNYERLDDGRRVVTTDILAQTTDAGDWVVVGSLAGVLDPNPPKFPSKTGHFHGRWTMK